ncbi:RNA polymerase sigma factor [Microbacterium hominis]|uniref:RNA polymerase sigma factor n=1 Tax=Microbacterium hominis TaxID=162426 RepID=A0A7D4THK9_9MICO|nr:RNA polymerase sigma factor [Microbacterium hominis]QKJ20960.1 RNA polymerase sigma factor [Microbacterium hominis]
MRDGFEELFRSHHAAVRRFATRRVGAAAADDIVASTFELALHRLPARHPHPTGWLFRAADNLCKAEVTRQAREIRMLRDAGVIADTEVDAADSDVDVLLRLLEMLPAAQREVLQLTYWDRLSAADVGVVLGCSVPAVWKRISRAKAMLRAAWPAPDDRDTWEEMVTVGRADDH